MNPLTAYYINHQGHTERFDSMQGQANRLYYHNLRLYRFPAIMPETLARFKPWLKGRYLTCAWLSRQIGTHCCSVSHVALWMHVLANHEEPVLVLEDDVIVDPVFYEQWNRDKLSLPSNFGLAFFGLWDNDDNKEAHSRAWHRICARGNGGHFAYIINPARIADMLARILPLCEEIDAAAKDMHADIPLFSNRHKDLVGLSTLNDISVRVQP